jgi:hypothetical protein
MLIYTPYGIRIEEAQLFVSLAMGSLTAS